MEVLDNAPTQADESQVSGAAFAGLGLQPGLVAAIVALGYEEPTAIQRESIEPLLAGRDILGQAATGTGKTAAFALPLLQRIGHTEGERILPRGLVLVPTRELAMQVAEAIHAYGRLLEIRVLPIYGGQAMKQQLRALERGVDIIVATPGRALDHLRRGTLKLHAVKMVVLDEADEMLDMGFAEDLDAILKELPKQRQTALFSATLPKRIVAISKQHLHDPVHVTIAHEVLAAGTKPRIREVAFSVQRRQKVTALARILDMENPTSVIVFCRTRLEVDELSVTFNAHGYQAEALHGGLSQEQRDRVLRNFKEGTSDILLATDVAARGLDIDHISHVVNFDVPSSPDVYVHRIGRTGRAGREGVAITLCEPREQRLLRNIEQHTKRKISVESVPTVYDLQTHRLESIRATIEEQLTENNLDRYRRTISQMSEEHELLDIAAAALKILDGLHQGLGDEAQDGEIEANTLAHANTSSSVKLYINAGRKDGIGPGDIVGAIANMAKIESRILGSITMTDRYALIDVPSNMTSAIIKAMRHAVIRGKKVFMREDREPTKR